ncbi:MAG TPA: fatty acyl-AMP ligase, partial [Polyangiaceae bacterium]|nr:fatty acyl-AMP ligase [Polyangiaceae bacterium]
MSKQPASIVDICRNHAFERGDRIAYRFSDGQTIVATLSFSELDGAAQQLAAFLQSRCQLGDRVLLLLEAGVDFVRAFFGCLYAGVTAVPLNLPVGARRLEKIRAIAQNCGARLMLASSASARSLEGEALDFEHVELNALCEREALAGASYRDPNVTSTTPAFLQYTSGSTGSPKGVVVTHANLLANEEAIKASCAHDRDTVFVGWLPLFHDMGLVGNVLQPAYVGIPSILMPPSAFVRRPLRWLQLISEYGGTTSGGPDFAYDVCVRRIDESQMEGLDLRSWRIAFNGSEPIRARTLEAFARKFAAVGFSSRAFYPVYGLAEATLFVSAPERGREPRIREVPASALEAGVIPAQDSRARDDATGGESRREHRLVSCGSPRGGQVVKIVHPETCAPCTEREVGEIWISGPNVARGYWNDPEQTARAFGAYTAQGEGPFLRTGDLGFLEADQLFVTGRIKDLLIVSGKNHYPQDIEHTVSR